MISLTKQDMQNVIEAAKNRILERVATRQDIQTACDASRDRVLTYVHDVQQQQYQLTRQTNVQTLQMGKRLANLETRISSLEGELKAVRGLLSRLVEIAEEQKVPNNVALRVLRNQYSV